MSGFLGAGDLYFDRFDDDGNSTGLVLLGNATALEITESSEIKERTSRMKATYGQVLDSVPIKKPAKISMTLNELQKENLALALLGSAATLSQASATDTTKAFTDVVVGKWYELGKFKISGVEVTVTAKTPVLNTDFWVNADAGLIKFGGSIVDGDDASVTFDAAAITNGAKVTGSVSPTIKGMLKLDGKNFATGENVIVDIYEAVLTPSSPVGFISEEFVELSMEGTLNTPEDQPAPYVVNTFA